MSMPKSNTKPVTRQRTANINLLQYANEMRNEGHFNDVSVIVENECIPANKMVLSRHSLFFEKMFRCEMKEKYESKVEIGSLNGKVVRSVIDYMYTGSIDIDDESALKLLEAADYLQLPDVKMFCFQYLESNITIDNWLYVLRAVVMYGGDDNKDGVYRYISMNFREIAQGDDFKALSFDYLKNCMSNLNRTKLLEALVFEALMNWIKYDIEARKNLLVDLIQLIKLDQLSCEFIEDVLKEDLIKESFECHRFLLAGLLQVNKAQRNELHGSKLISIGGRDSSSKVVEVYNLHGQASREYSNTPVKVWGHALLKGNGHIYCIGGSDDGNGVGHFNIHNNVWLTNVQGRTMTWKRASQMKERRYLMGATEHDNKLFVAGGNNRSTILKSVECYELPLNEWKLIHPMRQSRSGNALVSCQRCLYSLGGFNHETGYLSSVERLPDVLSTWAESRPMLKPRRWFAAVNCENAIYAIGGQCSDEVSATTKTVERFDPDQDEWMYVSKMHAARSAHAACVMHGKIYVSGGIDAESKAVCSIECYDPSLDSWSIVAETNHNLYYHTITVL